MTIRKKTTWKLGLVFMLMAALLSSPTLAKERHSRKKTVTTSRQRRKIRSKRPGKSDSKFQLRLGFDLGGRSRFTSHRRWVPGRYVTRTEQVLVESAHYEWHTQRVEVRPGYYETKHARRVEETLYDSQGNPHTVIVAHGGTENIWIPAQYELRKVKVWIPDRYKMRKVSVWIPGHWIFNKGFTHHRPHLNLGTIFRF